MDTKPLLSKQIGYDRSQNAFVVGTHDLKGNKIQASYSETDVNRLINEVYAGNSDEAHRLLAAQIYEPIRQILPYVEAYAPIFFMTAQYDYLEDNSLPVEDSVTMAWQSNRDGQIFYNQAGYSFTRPDFVNYQSGIKVSWEMARKAGWNFFQRQMSYALDDLTRKRDALARAALIAAIPSGSDYTVSGGALTKTSVDTVLKAKAGIGYPVQNVLINPTRMMDMFSTNWAMPTGFLMSPTVTDNLLRTLTFGNYGGANWYANPFVPTNEVWFGGDKSQIGWRQLRGTLEVKSQIDVTHGLDLHALRDAEQAYYVGNPYTLARITVTP